MGLNTKFLKAIVAAGLALGLCAGASFGSGTKTTKKGKKKGAAVEESGEPDKILYDRAITDSKRGKYVEERLSLQTLINTYPDSEYLAKAKLAIGDSYFKEGGTTGLTEAVSEYKDFITFFPFLDEAAYAQMQVGMAHFRMMEKSDRDHTQAAAAEDEFQTFLLKYPTSPIAPKAAQRLREVQEVLADGDFKVAQFYFLRGSRASALARLVEVVDRYPLYSQSDKALWMAANVYDKAEKRDVADKLYARLVREYPKSSLVPDAKKKLTAAGVPIPQPDPNVLARLEAEQKAPHKRPGMMHKSLGIIRSGPDVSRAARAGDPDLNPAIEAVSATDVLKPGLLAEITQSGGGAGTPGNSVGVQIVQAGSSPSSTAGTDVQPVTGGTSATPDTGSAGGSGSTDASRLPAPMGNGEATAAGNGGGTTTTDSSTPSNTEAVKPAPPAGTSDSTNAAQPSGTPDESSNGTPSASSGKPPASAANAPKVDSKKESSSKKKKGLRKIIPW